MSVPMGLLKAKAPTCNLSGAVTIGRNYSDTGCTYLLV